MEHGLPSQSRSASVLATLALACGLAATGSVVSSAPVSAHYDGRAQIAAKHTAATTHADPQLRSEPQAAGPKSNPGEKKARQEQKKAERAAKKEERLAAKKAAKKSSHEGDSTVASTKAPKAAKASKQAIDDSSLQGGNNDPLEGL